MPRLYTIEVSEEIQELINRLKGEHTPEYILNSFIEAGVMDFLKFTDKTLKTLDKKKKLI